MGAWIEIKNEDMDCLDFLVAPLVGAWIEILHLTFILSTIDVAPLVGAWIEIDNRWTNF